MSDLNLTHAESMEIINLRLLREYHKRAIEMRKIFYKSKTYNTTIDDYLSKVLSLIDNINIIENWDLDLLEIINIFKEIKKESKK